MLKEAGVLLGRESMFGTTSEAPYIRVSNSIGEDKVQKIQQVQQINLVAALAASGEEALEDPPSRRSRARRFIID